MPDITKCEGTGCPLKESCKRFAVESSEYKQSFFLYVPYHSVDKKCDYYLAIPFCKLTPLKQNKTNGTNE